jgi:hypothetical protein
VEAHEEPESINWSEFRAVFRAHHVPQGVIKLKKEFHDLKQGSISVNEYVIKFTQLSHYAPHKVDTDEKKQECLEDEGYEFRIKDKCCSIFLNDMYYGRCPVVNGLYVLDLESSEINNVSAKRICMNNSNTTFSWHCRLGHTGKKRIEKLHKDGLLDSFDQESFKMCESCLIGKMMKAPFVGQSERASELLGLIHTDVCGPMNSTTRGGFQYFITFTDDMSRYGYIYLMRNKAESFEKFKEFQNEVQNNTGKTIKFLRSDRGGEYLSHEFSDHLKSCGIVPQLTPPGTP